MRCKVWWGVQGAPPRSTAVVPPPAPPHVSAACRGRVAAAPFNSSGNSALTLRAPGRPRLPPVGQWSVATAVGGMRCAAWPRAVTCAGTSRFPLTPACYMTGRQDLEKNRVCMGLGVAGSN